MLLLKLMNGGDKKKGWVVAGDRLAMVKDAFASHINHTR